MENKSGFHLYSVGIVAKDIVEDEIEIEVFPIENQTHTDGDIDETEVTKVISNDIHGNVRSIVLNKRVTVMAEWIPLGDTNRKTAPDVKKGEEVRIYRYANTDEYYWHTLYNEYDLRRREKIIHMYGNTGNFKEVLDFDNTYWTKMDTINKKVQWHTSDNDGELTTWDIDLDTKKGILTVKDGRGNYIKHDAAKDTLTAEYKKEINLIAPTINMKSDNHNIDTTTYTANSTTRNINSGVTNVKSKVNVNGATAVNGDTSISGGSLTHRDVNIGSTHKHRENNKSGGLTNVPE